MSDLVKVFIPAPGDKIKLAKAWAFDMAIHPSNESVLKAIDHWQPNWNMYYLKAFDRWLEIDPVRVRFPKDTVLTIEVIDANRFASKQPNAIYFRILKNDCPDKRLCGTRFWAPLVEVNKIVCNRWGQDGKTTMRKVDLVEGRFGLIDVDAP